jgi:iron(III) transport system permease protein
MWLSALLNSILIYGVVLVIALPCSLIVSVMMMRTYLPGRKLMAALMFSAVAIPVYVQAGAWNSIFGQFGWWTLTQVGAIQNGWGGALAVAIIQAAYVFPWLVLCLCFGLSYLDQSAEENAWLDTGTTNTLRRVTIPHLVPYLALAMIVTLLLLSTDMTVTNLYRVDTVTERFYQQASMGEMRWNDMAMPMLQGVAMLCLVLSTYAVVWRSRRLPFSAKPISERQQFRELRFMIPRSQMFIWGSAAWCNTFFWIALPLLSLIWNAGWLATVAPDSNRITGYWSLQQLLTTIWKTPFEFHAEFLWSLYLGVCSATFWLSIAIALSFMLPSKSWWNRGVLLCLGILVFVPGPLAGLATIYVWNRTWPTALGWLYDNTLIGPIFALGVRMLPLALFAVMLIRSRLPTHTQEVARLEGISTRKLWLSWYSRNLRSLLSLWILLFLLSVADLSAVLLVLPPGVTPISSRIFELLHYGVRYQESGVCLIISLFSVIGAAGIYFLSVRPMAAEQIISRELSSPIESLK